MKLGIKLGDKGPGDYPVSAPSQNRDVYYPEFTVTQNEDDEEADLGDAPEEGTMTIRYCISRSSENNKTGQCNYTVEVREIISASADKVNAPSKKYDEAGEALDKLAAEKSAGKNSGEDY